MGTPGTWYILSILNLFASRQGKCVNICGDDMIGIFDDNAKNCYLKSMKALSIKVNKEKSFLSRKAGIFCEDLVNLQYKHTYRCKPGLNKEKILKRIFKINLIKLRERGRVNQTSIYKPRDEIFNPKKDPRKFVNNMVIESEKNLRGCKIRSLLVANMAQRIPKGLYKLSGPYILTDAIQQIYMDPALKGIAYVVIRSQNLKYYYREIRDLSHSHHMFYIAIRQKGKALLPKSICKWRVIRKRGVSIDESDYEAFKSKLIRSRVVKADLELRRSIKKKGLSKALEEKGLRSKFMTEVSYGCLNFKKPQRFRNILGLGKLGRATNYIDRLAQTKPCNYPKLTDGLKSIAMFSNPFLKSLRHLAYKGIEIDLPIPLGGLGLDEKIRDRILRKRQIKWICTVGSAIENKFNTESTRSTQYYKPSSTQMLAYEFFSKEFKQVMVPLHDGMKVVENKEPFLKYIKRRSKIIDPFTDKPNGVPFEKAAALFNNYSFYKTNGTLYLRKYRRANTFKKSRWFTKAKSISLYLRQNFRRKICTRKRAMAILKHFSELKIKPEVMEELSLFAPNVFYMNGSITIRRIDRKSRKAPKVYGVFS